MTVNTPINVASISKSLTAWEVLALLVAPDRDAALFAVANSDHGSEVLAEMMRVWGEYYGLTLHEYF